MQDETIARVQNLRSRILAEKALLSDLDAKLVQPSMKPLLKHASNSLDDVEQLFLGKALEEPRTPAAESKWLDYAELFFQIAVQQRKGLEDILTMYGPGAVAV